jgi:hypothetical protein
MPSAGTPSILYASASWRALDALVLTAEGLHRLAEPGLVDAGAGGHRERVRVAGDALALPMHRGEDPAVRGIDGADLLQRVEQPLRHLVASGEADGHAPERHVRRQLAGPGFEHRLERVAVRALVPEELGDVDPARRRQHAGGQRLRQLDEVRAFDRCLRQHRGGQGQAGAGELEREVAPLHGDPFGSIGTVRGQGGLGCTRGSSGRCSGLFDAHQLRLDARGLQLRLLRFGIRARVVRADPHPIDGAAGLFAFGDLRTQAEHRQPGALLFGLFGT